MAGPRYHHLPRPASSLVTTPTELPRLILEVFFRYLHANLSYKFELSLDKFQWRISFIIAIILRAAKRYSSSSELLEKDRALCA